MSRRMQPLRLRRLGPLRAPTNRFPNPDNQRETAMTAFWLTAYVLIWPVIVAGVLAFIARAFFREWLDAHRRGEPMI